MEIIETEKPNEFLVIKEGKNLGLFVVKSSVDEIQSMVERMEIKSSQ